MRAAPAQAELPAPNAVERLLIVRLDEIGDFVLATPFLRAVRRRYPRARITLLANASVEGLAGSCPYIDELLLYPARRRRPPFDQVGAHLAARRFARARLRERSFQLAVNPRADIDNACALAMAYYAGIPYRVGFAEDAFPLRRVKDRCYRRFLTHAVRREDAMHEALCSLRVAAFLGSDIGDARLELWPSSAETVRARERLSRFLESGRALIALAPGGGLARRRWPARSFALLATQLIERAGAQIVLIGGPGEEEIAASVIVDSAKDASHFLDTIGSASLGETAALLGGCDLFVGNDSGPMHVAAAMGVPCIEISCHPLGGDPLGENSPARFGPWGVPSRVLRPPRAVPPCRASCIERYAHCIETVEVPAVLQAAMELLATREGGRGRHEEARRGPMQAV